MPKSIPGVMKEWKTGILHSGSSKGPVVRSQKQAVAIALSEQRQMKQAALNSHPNASRLGAFLHPKKIR